MLPLAVGAIAIVAAAVIAIAMSQSAPGSSGGATPGGGSPASSGATSGSAGAAAVTGEALPQFPDSGDDPAVGQAIPEVTGAAFDGSPVAIARDGTPKLLLFLAHWCPHCRDEVPKIQDWIDANGMPKGVDFVSVATSITPTAANYPPDAWLAREGWTPPVVVDASNAVAQAYGLTAFPYWVAVNGDGTVARRWTGETDDAELQSVLDGLRATAASPAPSGS